MPYRIKIDRRNCTGYAEGVGVAPEEFQLGDDSVSIVVDPEGTDDQAILDAARSCPLDAITLVDEFKAQVWRRQDRLSGRDRSDVESGPPRRWGPPRRGARPECRTCRTAAGTPPSTLPQRRHRAPRHRGDAP